MVTDIGLIASAICIGAGTLACAHQNHAALAAAYGALAEGDKVKLAQVLILTGMGETLAVFGLLGGLIIMFVI